MPAAATHRLLADSQLLRNLLQLLVVQDVGQLLGVFVAVSHAVRGAQGGVRSDVHALQARWNPSVHSPPKLAALSSTTHNVPLPLCRSSLWPRRISGCPWNRQLQCFCMDKVSTAAVWYTMQA